jgi:hypothetical protein
MSKQEIPRWGKNSQNVEWRLAEIKVYQKQLKDLDREKASIERKIKLRKKEMGFEPFKTNDVLTNKKVDTYVPVGSILLVTADSDACIDMEGFLREDSLIIKGDKKGPYTGPSQTNMRHIDLIKIGEL